LDSGFQFAQGSEELGEDVDLLEKGLGCTLPE
jgi:hypothetical protein